MTNDRKCPFREKIREHWPAAYRVLAPIGMEAIPMVKAFHALLGQEYDRHESSYYGLRRLMRDFDDRIAAGTLPQDDETIKKLYKNVDSL